MQKLPEISPVLKFKKENSVMQEECMICKAPLQYLEQDTLMECAICHKKENSKTHIMYATNATKRGLTASSESA